MDQPVIIIKDPGILIILIMVQVVLINNQAIEDYSLASYYQKDQSAMTDTV